MALKLNCAFTAATLRLLSCRHWWLSLLFWLVLVVPARAALELRVAIEKDSSQVEIGSSTSAIVTDSAGRKLGEITALNAFAATPSSRGVALGNWQSDRLIIEPSGDGLVWINGGWYRGRTEIVRQGQQIIAVNRVDLEEYLYSVVGSEAIPSWPQEALRAQAVAARTYALYQRSKSTNSLYDLDTTTDTQVYKGLSREYVTTHEAVKATAGQVITYNGKPILAAFHSSSGGHTENVEDVWSSPLPYLRGVVDYDQSAPVFQWTKSFSSTELSRHIGGVGTIKAMIPEQTTPRGRIIAMKIVGDRGTKILKGGTLRQALDLRSTLFTVSSTQGIFQLLGRGYGHGIGLSQWGTYYLAEKGTDYKKILAHYYQNARLTKIR